MARRAVYDNTSRFPCSAGSRVDGSVAGHCAVGEVGGAWDGSEVAARCAWGWPQWARGPEEGAAVAAH
eukprot:14702033-Heterocapsa_arctica.AAC.1